MARITDIAKLIQNLNEILKSQGKDLDINELAEKGLLRKPDGTKFVKKDTPEQTAEEIATYLADDNNKLVLFEQQSANDPKKPEKMVTKRSGSIRVNSESGELSYTLDCPTKDNDYSKPNLENLENAEVSLELKKFVKDLIELTKQAGLNMNILGDKARLKLYYNDSGELIERDVNKAWKIISSNDASRFDGDSQILNTDALDEIDNELGQNERYLEQVLNELNSPSPNMGIVHQFYAVMQCAKDGGLMLTKRGELIKDSHPVLVDEKGNLTLGPSYKDADEKTRETAPYKLILNHISKSPKAEDQDYSDRLDAQQTKLYTEYFTGYNLAMENTCKKLFNDSKEKGLSKEEFLRQIMEMPRNATKNVENKYNELLEENGSTKRITARKIKATEQAQREQLSKKALYNYFSSIYDSYDLTPVMKKAALENGLEKEFFSISGSRDRHHFLFSPGLEEASINKNLYRLTLFTGSGIDPKTPGAKDLKDKMYAQAINDVLAEIAGFDYEQYLGLDDEKFVEKWPEIYPAFFRLSVAKDQIGSIMSSHADNKYINQDLVQKALKTERRIMSYNYENTMRIRTIMNPYYAVFPVDIAKNMSLEQRLSESDFKDKDLDFTRFINLFIEGIQAREMGISEEIKALFAEDQNINDISDSIQFFDATGKKVQTIELEQKLKNNELILIAYEYDPDKITAISMDKKTLRPVINHKLFEKNESRLESAIEKIQDRISENIKERDSKRCLSWKNLFYSTGSSPVDHYRDVAKEIAQKKLSVDTVFNEIKKECLTKPSMTKEEFANLTGMDLAYMPEDGEIAYKRNLTVKAHKALLEAAINSEKGLSISSKSIPGWTDRILHYSLYKLAPPDEAFNKRLEETLRSGSIEDQTKIIEERFKAYLEDEKFFDGKYYTDEKLIENWAKLESIGTGLGMEYVSIMDQIASHGIKINPELRKHMDIMHQKVYAYNNFYKPRMELLANKYFQYGLDKLTTDAASKLMSSNDPQAHKAGMGLLGYNGQVSNAVGQYIAYSSFPGGDDEVDLIIDDTFKVYPPKQNLEYGEAARAGKKLFVVRKGSDEIKQFSYSNTDIFPPDTEEIPIKMSPEECREMVQNARVKLIETDNTLSKKAKELALLLVARKIELDEIAANPQAENFEATYKDKLAEYLSYVAIKTAAKNNKYNDESIEMSMDKDNIDLFKNELLTYGFVDTVYNQIKSEKGKLQFVDPGFIEAKLDEARKNQSKEIQNKITQQRTEANKKLDEQSFGKIQKIYSVSKKALKLRAKDNFLDAEGLKMFETLPKETALKSMTLSRCSVQALTLAMMLNQGYSVDQAMSEECTADRNKIGIAAMNAIRSSDFDFIRTNFLKGMKSLCDFVDEKYAKLNDFSISEFMSPENTNLIFATTMLKDFSQEFDNCQKNLTEEKKLNNDDSTQLQNRAEFLGQIATRLLDSIKVPEQRNFDTAKTMLCDTLNYVCMSNYIKKLKELPENEGKKISEIFTMKENLGYNSMLVQLYNESKNIKTTSLSQDAKDTIISLAMDDTLKDYLFLSVDISENDPKVNVNLNATLERIKERKPTKEIIDKLEPEAPKKEVKLEAAAKKGPKK